MEAWVIYVYTAYRLLAQYVPQVHLTPNTVYRLQVIATMERLLDIYLH